GCGHVKVPRAKAGAVDLGQGLARQDPAHRGARWLSGSRQIGSRGRATRSRRCEPARAATPARWRQPMGKDKAFVLHLIGGAERIDDAIAGELARVLGGSAAFWERRQHYFDAALARIAGAVEQGEARAWLGTLPLKRDRPVAGGDGVFRRDQYGRVARAVCGFCEFKTKIAA